MLRKVCHVFIDSRESCIDLARRDILEAVVKDHMVIIVTRSKRMQCVYYVCDRYIVVVYRFLVKILNTGE